MTKEELVSKMNQERNKLYGLETVGKKTIVKATAVGKELNLPPAQNNELTLPFEFDKREPAEQQIETTIDYRYQSNSKERSEFRAMTARRNQEESAIKFAINDDLVEFYINLETFQHYFDIIKDIYGIRDIYATSNNPKLKNEKKDVMTKYIKRLAIYYEEAKKLYEKFYEL